MGCGASKKQEDNVAGGSNNKTTSEETLCPKSWQELSENTTATTVDLKDIPADEFKLLYPKATPLKLGQQVKKLVVAPLPEGMTHIGSEFLENAKVTTIDFTQVTTTKNLGKNFLKGCANLKSVTINMPSLNTIGANLFQECAMLTTLDFSSPCPALTKIDKNFGEKLTSLENINLSGWTGVVEIESNFLNRAISLTAIDLSPLVSLQTIGAEFMSECKKLSKIGMKNLASVSKVGKRFLFIAKQEEGPALNREILAESTGTTSTTLIDAARDVSGLKIQEVDENASRSDSTTAAPATEANGKKDEEPASEEEAKKEAEAKAEQEQPPAVSNGEGDAPTQSAEDEKKEEGTAAAEGGEAAPPPAAAGEGPESPVGIFKTVTSSRDLKAVGPEAN